MKRGSNPIKVQEWTERLARFQQSPLSVARFCEAEGVSPASFYQWQRKLRKLAAANSSDSTASPTKKRAAFQAVQLTACGPLAATGRVATGPALTVCLPGGIQVQVADNLAAIQAVMRELASPQEIRDDSHHADSRHADHANDIRYGAPRC